MGHGHPEDGELVGLASQRAAGGHHVGQLCDIGCHLVAAPALDFAVVLPAVGSKDKQRSSREFHKRRNTDKYSRRSITDRILSQHHHQQQLREHSFFVERCHIQCYAIAGVILF